MKIHEYQAKELFRKYGVPVPDGGVAFTPEEARDVAQKLGGFPVVVKAQIHAGGRGKGGGVKLAQSLDEVGTLAGQIVVSVALTTTPRTDRWKGGRRATASRRSLRLEV